MLLAKDPAWKKTHKVKQLSAALEMVLDYVTLARAGATQTIQLK